MKLVKVVLGMLVFLSITACSDNREKVEEIKLKPYSVSIGKGEDMNNSIWGDKPSYKLKIKGTHTKILVFINGVNVYEHFALSSCYIEYPINDYITTGKNEIKVQLISGIDEKFEIDKQAKVTVNLLVYSSKTGKEYTVSTIDYDNRSKDKLSLSSEAKEYKISEISPLDSEFVTIGSINKKTIKKYQGTDIHGIELSQTIKLRTPFPRWKFLDSEEIIDKSFDQEVSDKEYENLKSTKEIQELYAIYGKIHSAIKENNVASIIDMFDERGIEKEAAYYDPKGYNKEGQLKRLIEVSSGGDYEIRDFNPNKEFYFIEDNRKLIYLDVIRFKNKKTGMYRKFGMSFRRENGKWILTR